jgi:hypothetical protein
MLSAGIAVCYLGAFLLELVRLLRSNRWTALPAGIGFVLHSSFLVQQHMLAAHPIGGSQMYFLASAWGLILIYLLWMYKYPNIPFGLILLPVTVLLLLGGNAESTAIRESTMPPCRPLFRMFHSGMFFLTTLTVTVGFAAGVFYFIQDYLLRKKYLPGEKIKLPALEWSFTACRLSLVSATICLFIGMISGEMLRQTKLPPDRLIAGSHLFLFLFSVLCFMLHFRTKKNYLVAAWTITAFLFLLFVLYVALFSGNAHWNGIKFPD